MLAALRKSRGWSKFRKSRGAMIALSVILLYLVLSLWIIAVENVHALGQRLGRWDLGDAPLLGLLLPERTLERVGPPTFPGFGALPALDRRTDQADWMLRFADERLKELERARSAERGLEPIVQSLAGRSLADRPPSELRAALTAAQETFNQVDAVKRHKTALITLIVACEKAAAFAAPTPLAAAPSPTLRADVLAAVEEVDFAREDADAPPWAIADALSAIDPAPLLTAIDALDRADPEAKPAELGVLVPTTLLGSLQTAAQQRLDALATQVEPRIGEIEAAVERLLPRPTGLAGFLYEGKLLLGTDRQGRSILIRALYSAKVAIQVGAIVALISVVIGSLLGAAAAYYGGPVDHAVTWLYSTLSSLPQLVLLAVLSFMFLGSAVEKTLIPVYVAFGLTFWIGPCRVIRGEVLKIKQLEYAQAATAIGFGRFSILLRHVLPNTVHLMFINFSLLFIGAVKSEVILTFLGLGIKEGASWGIMISQSRPEVVSGFFWQIGAATFFMLVLVLAFNVVSDALQDAFDPKHVG